MSETQELAEIAAELDSIAVAFEAHVWRNAGHDRPTDFATWQDAFQIARQSPQDDHLHAESSRLLNQLLLG